MRRPADDLPKAPARVLSSRGRSFRGDSREDCSLRPLVEARTRVSRRGAGSGAVVRVAVGWDVPVGRGPFAFRAFRRRIDDVPGAATRGRSQPFGPRGWSGACEARSTFVRALPAHRPCFTSRRTVLRRAPEPGHRGPKSVFVRSEEYDFEGYPNSRERLPAHPIALAISRWSGWRLFLRGAALWRFRADREPRGRTRVGRCLGCCHSRGGTLGASTGCCSALRSAEAVRWDPARALSGARGRAVSRLALSRPCPGEAANLPTESGTPVCRWATVAFLPARSRARDSGSGAAPPWGSAAISRASFGSAPGVTRGWMVRGGSRSVSDRSVGVAVPSLPHTPDPPVASG